MKLTWSELKDNIPPLNLWNFPCWEVQLNKGKKMLTIELTKEELEAFKTIYYEQGLNIYLEYAYEEEEAVGLDTAFSSLFLKLGIDLGEDDAN